MPSVTHVDTLHEVYRDRPLKMWEHVKTWDYISNPKTDGYRSVHLVYKYRSGSGRYERFNGHRIEVQIRSIIQHYWATAIEVAETFTRMPLKTQTGSMLIRDLDQLASWRRFFLLSSSLFALIENRPTAPGTPIDRSEIIEELRHLNVSLNAMPLMMTWIKQTKFDLPSKTEAGNIKQFLMQMKRLDQGIYSLAVTGYSEGDFIKAFEDYVKAEKPERNAPSTNVVLVTVDSLEALKSAYPNYFSDVADFQALLLREGVGYETGVRWEGK
jgi:hypothetical protein